MTPLTWFLIILGWAYAFRFGWVMREWKYKKEKIK